MKPAGIVLVVSLIILQLSCVSQSPELPHGSGGPVGELFQLHSWEQGLRKAYVVWFATGEKKDEPALVILVRLPNRTPRADFNVSVNVSGEHRVGGMHMQSGELLWTLGGVEKPLGSYTLTQTVDEPPIEELTFGGKTYDLEKGRVFMVDAANQPFRLVQSPASIPAVPFKADEVELLTIKRITETLASENQAIRKFWSHTQE
jgi:hypothetical protein